MKLRLSEKSTRMKVENLQIMYSIINAKQFNQFNFIISLQQIIELISHQNIFSFQEITNLVTKHL